MAGQRVYSCSDAPLLLLLTISATAARAVRSGTVTSFGVGLGSPAAASSSDRVTSSVRLQPGSTSSRFTSPAEARVYSHRA